MAAYKRSVFLINKRFQIRFCLYVCSWLIALSAVYPIIVYNLFGYLIRYVSLDPFGPPLDGILKTRSEVLWLLVLFQAVFALATFLISIFISHRIAGPLFKLGRFLDNARAGNLKDRLFFRKTDHFQELATRYNDMVDGIRGLIGQNQQKIATATSKIESVLKSASPEVRRELEGALVSLREAQNNIQI
ncbi:MAG TPA: methyl-accepting chemotaxis protein [Bdellovibrionota bacterium]|nr:methyl-accepting chemotaxis protein [Bdellovibrionota bacterium]